MSACIEQMMHNEHQNTQPESQPIRLSMQGKIITASIIVGLALLLVVSIGSVLTPFIAAIITAYIFNPLVTLLENRTRAGRAVWIAVLYVLAFSLLYWLGTWLWPRIALQTNDLITRLPDIVVGVAATFEGNRTFEIGPTLTIDLTPLEEHIINAATDLTRTLSEGVPHLVFSALETAIYTLIYLIVTFYLLLQSRELTAWTVRLIPAPYRTEICSLGRQIDHVLSAYIRGQLMLIVIMAVLLYIPLSILQVPYALVIAIASGVLELIPILGPWSAAIIAMTVALFQASVPFGLSNLGLAGLIGIIYFTLRQIEDSFIIPNIMGHLVRLHPAVVLFAVLAGGSLAGPLGLLLSIPFAAVVRILLTYIYSKLTDTTADFPNDPPPSRAKKPARDREPERIAQELSPEHMRLSEGSE
jgi:predicted PurR-regulated permease PerM